MPVEVTTDQVWDEIDKRLFAVMGMVTSRGEARTAGIVYTVKDRKLYIGTSKHAWKTRHVQRNPNVSITVTIPKRIPFWPFVTIPPAAISFQGTATVHSIEDLDPAIPKALYHGMEIDQAFVEQTCVIRITPRGEFITYGSVFRC